MKILNLFLFLSICASTLRLSGQSITGSEAMESANVIMDFNLLNVENQRNGISNAQLLFKIDLGDDFYLIKDDYYFSAEVNYSIAIKDEAGEQIGSTINSTFVITRENPEKLDVFDVTSQVLEGGRKAEITIYTDHNEYTLLDGTTPITGGELFNYVNNNITFRYENKISYKLDVRNQSGNLIEPMGIIGLNVTTQNRYIDFTWNLPDAGIVYPNYEIQVLRLYNTDEALSNNPNEIKTIVDWTKSLKVETQSSIPNVRLAIMEGTGIYIWRVRPIGNYYEGGIANSENYGRWSIAPENGEEITINRTAISNNSAFYLIDPDENINWIYSRVFTEGDPANGTRVLEGMNYADPLLNPRQSQSHYKNSGQDLNAVSQVVLDYSQRPSLTTIPVPVSGELTGYKVGFVHPDSDPSGLYTALHFDVDEKVNNPERVNDGTGSAYSYYSDNNIDDKFVPDAEGYPFSRSVFATDGSGRVIEQSSVGKRHALGLQTDGMGRTTRVLVSTASDVELIRLFGDEAPVGESVLKTLTIDPNNVCSVTYTSKEGNVIATALVTESTENLQSLSDPAESFTINNSTTQNIYDNKKFISSRRVAFNIETPVTFSYNLDDNTQNWGCLNSDCSYGLVFYIYNLSDHNVFKSNVFIVDPSNVDLSGMTWTFDGASDVVPTPVLNSSGNTVILAPGEYFITKVIFSDLQDDEIAEIVQESNSDLMAIIDVITGWMSAVQNEDDFYVFENNMEEFESLLGTYILNQTTENLNAVLSHLGLDPALHTIPNGFSLSYVNDITTNDPSNLTIGSGCCEDISIKIEKPQKCFLCVGPNGINFIRENNDITLPSTFTSVYNLVNESFIGYLNQYLSIIDPGGTLSFDKIAPGFTKEKMAFMITNMLLSKYYSGNSLYDASAETWYKAEEDNAGQLVYSLNDFGNRVPVNESNSFNYDCEQLFNCWINAVNTINVFDFSGEENVNIMDEFNNRQGEDVDNPHGEDGSAGTYYDDPENREHRFNLLNFIISWKMRKFNNSSKGIVTSERMTQQSSFSNIFIECAGQQFAGIIDENLAIPSEYDDFDALFPGNCPSWGIDVVGPEHTSTLGYSYVPFFTDANGEKVKNYKDFEDGLDPSLPGFNIWTYELYYPYMLRPEWMFKYFIYNIPNNNSVNDASLLLPNQKRIEMISCYDPPLCGSSYCFSNCNYHHLNWNSAQRLNFYKQISMAPEFNENQISFSEVNNTCPDEIALNQMVENELAAARNACEHRRGEMRSKIITALSECYEIVDCIDPSYSGLQVTMRQIDEMTEQAYQTCLEIIQTVEDNVNASAVYPACTTTSCSLLDDTGQCYTSQEAVIVLFDPCDRVKLDQIMNWDFIPIIPGCTSNSYTGGTECNPLSDYSLIINIID